MVNLIMPFLSDLLHIVAVLWWWLVILDVSLGIVVSFFLAEEGRVWFFLDRVYGHDFKHVGLE